MKKVFIRLLAILCMIPSLPVKAGYYIDYEELEMNSTHMMNLTLQGCIYFHR